MDCETANGRDVQNPSQMWYKQATSSSFQWLTKPVATSLTIHRMLNWHTYRSQVFPDCLEVLIRKEHYSTDTQSTVLHIRENFNNIKNHLGKMTYNNESFNLDDTAAIEQLAARGERSSDQLHNLNLVRIRCCI